MPTFSINSLKNDGNKDVSNDDDDTTNGSNPDDHNNTDRSIENSITVDN